MAALAAAISAIAAASQIWFFRREYLQRATFEHLREIDRRLQATWIRPPQVLRDSVAQAYVQRRELSEEERCYLACLNALDLLALARQVGAVDREVTDRYLRTIVRVELVSLTSLRALQHAWNDDGVYEHLHQLLLEYQSHNRKPT